MKKVALAVVVSLTLSSFATVGYAAENHQKQDALKVVKVSESQTPSKNLVDIWIKKLALIAEGKSKANQPSTPAHEAPEIDASSAGLALALMGGIVALRRERRGKSQA